MPASVVVGVQWGDEGKGKIIDILASRADVVVRSQGGNNAGHTVENGGEVYKLQLIPSGILYPDTLCLLGSGVVRARSARQKKELVPVIWIRLNAPDCAFMT